MHISKVYPQNLIVYREGTSEGYIKNILEQELIGIKNNFKGIKRAMQELCPNSKLIILSVNKRIDSKIFIGVAGDSIRFSNP